VLPLPSELVSLNGEICGDANSSERKLGDRCIDGDYDERDSLARMVEQRECYMLGIFFNSTMFLFKAQRKIIPIYVRNDNGLAPTRRLTYS
jgi:hypothetical protein